MPRYRGKRRVISECLSDNQILRPWNAEPGNYSQRWSRFANSLSLLLSLSVSFLLFPWRSMEKTVRRAEQPSIASEGMKRVTWGIVTIVLVSNVLEIDLFATCSFRHVCHLQSATVMGERNDYADYGRARASVTGHTSAVVHVVTPQFASLNRVIFPFKRF